LPPPLPRAVVYPELREEVVASVVKDYIASEFRQFNEELAKLGKDAKKPETRALLAKHIDDFEKKYGLTHGKSEGFRDRYSLINDPGLAPMKDDYVQNQIRQSATSQGAMSPDLKGERFGNMFFDQSGMPSGQGESLYQPSWLGQDPARSLSLKSDEKYFLYWKTDEEAAKERTFDAAKADVEKAWKLDKARELAKKAAEDMQKQIQDKSIRDPAALRDFAASQKTELIEIGPIAKLSQSPALQPGQPTEYIGPILRWVLSLLLQHSLDRRTVHRAKFLGASGNLLIEPQRSLAENFAHAFVGSPALVAKTFELFQINPVAVNLGNRRHPAAEHVRHEEVVL